jgi:hypothetical protein
MKKWEYATLWFDRSISKTEVFLITSSERRKLGESSAGGGESITQEVIYWADHLGDEGWKAFSSQENHILFRRERDEEAG